MVRELVLIRQAADEGAVPRTEFTLSKIEGLERGLWKK
jgi:hypothetical protein